MLRLASTPFLTSASPLESTVDDPTGLVLVSLAAAGGVTVLSSTGAFSGATGGLGHPASKNTIPPSIALVSILRMMVSMVGLTSLMFSLPSIAVGPPSRLPHVARLHAKAL